MSSCSQIFSDEALLRRVQEYGAIPVGSRRSLKAGAGGGSESARQEAAKIIQSSTTETGFDRGNPRRCGEVIDLMDPR